MYVVTCGSGGSGIWFEDIFGDREMRFQAAALLPIGANESVCRQQVCLLLYNVSLLAQNKRLVFMGGDFKERDYL